MIQKTDVSGFIGKGSWSTSYYLPNNAVRPFSGVSSSRKLMSSSYELTASAFKVVDRGTESMRGEWWLQQDDRR